MWLRLMQLRTVQTYAPKDITETDHKVDALISLIFCLHLCSMEGCVSELTSETTHVPVGDDSQSFPCEKPVGGACNSTGSSRIIIETPCA